MIQILRVPSWGIKFGEARHYGRRWWIQVGPWVALVWPIREDRL